MQVALCRDMEGSSTGGLLCGRKGLLRGRSVPGTSGILRLIRRSHPGTRLGYQASPRPASSARRRAAVLLPRKPVGLAPYIDTLRGKSHRTTLEQCPGQTGQRRLSCPTAQPAGRPSSRHGRSASDAIGSLRPDIRQAIGEVFRLPAPRRKTRLSADLKELVGSGSIVVECRPRVGYGNIRGGGNPWSATHGIQSGGSQGMLP